MRAILPHGPTRGLIERFEQTRAADVEQTAGVGQEVHVYTFIFASVLSYSFILFKTV